jgi:dihydroxy-acid dehydratase
VSPEAATGNNFAVVRTGDLITLDVPNRSVNVALSDEEFAGRKSRFIPPEPSVSRGYASLYIDHVQQAHLGADMDFLRGKSGSKVTRDSH